MSHRPEQTNPLLPTIERKIGCWNCVSWMPMEGRAFWKSRRIEELTAAVEKTLTSPQGEADRSVVNTRKMVASVDKAMSQPVPLMGMCRTRDLPRDNPIGDLVAHAYGCEHWTGAQGASLARAGGTLEKLPGELMADRIEEAKKSG